MDGKMKKKTINDRPPNFRGESGNLYLVRCFACDAKHGTENYALAVSGGYCAFCGWIATSPPQEKEGDN